MKYWYLAVLSIVLMLALSWSEWKRKFVLALIFKTLASLCFVLIGLFSLPLAVDQQSAKYLFIGLILGAVGDVFLNVCRLVKKPAVVFLLGGTSFFLRHILYLLVLIPAARAYFVPAVIAGMVTAISILVFLHWRVETDRLLYIESLGYMVTVSLMASFAVFGAVAQAGDTARLLRAVGGVLFLTSDTMLFFRMIKKEKAPAILGFLLLLAYYPAQCLIALSIQFM